MKVADGPAPSSSSLPLLFSGVLRGVSPGLRTGAVGSVLLSQAPSGLPVPLGAWSGGFPPTLELLD